MQIRLNRHPRGYGWEENMWKTFWKELQSQQFKEYPQIWLQLERTTIFIDSNCMPYTFLEAEVWQEKILKCPTLIPAGKRGDSLNNGRAKRA